MDASTQSEALWITAAVLGCVLYAVAVWVYEWRAER